MKKLLSIVFLFPFLAFAQTDPSPSPDALTNSEGYVSFGVGPLPIPFPFFGIGGRFQQGHHGFDASAQASSIIFLSAVKGNASYLYYFKPNLASQFYVGAGASAMQVFGEQNLPLLASEFTFGKEYTNETGDRRFFQLQVDFPEFQLHRNGKLAAFPVAVFSYGICF